MALYRQRSIPKRESVPQSLTLTAAQHRALRCAADNELGVVEMPGGRPGHAGATWVKMMERLSTRGLCKPYVHGGYEITKDGRFALNISLRS